MLNILVALVIGQAPVDKEFSLPCPQGHKFNVLGHQEGGYFLLKLKSEAPSKNFGIDLAKLPSHPGGQAWYGGNVDYSAARGAAGEKPNRVHVTFIGSQVEREAARKNLEGDPGFRYLSEAMGDYLAVQDYGPENPLVKEVGLPNGGRPDVIIQTTKGGRVTYRARSYPGADVVVHEIRKADPRYDPDKDPNGSGLDGLSAMLKYLGANDSMPEDVLIGLAGGVALVVLIRNKELT
jgi:hypothetical protein